MCNNLRYNYRILLNAILVLFLKQLLIEFFIINMELQGLAVLNKKLLKICLIVLIIVLIFKIKMLYTSELFTNLIHVYEN